MTDPDKIADGGECDAAGARPSSAQSRRYSFRGHLNATGGAAVGAAMRRTDGHAARDMRDCRGLVELAATCSARTAARPAPHSTGIQAVTYLRASASVLVSLKRGEAELDELVVPGR